jgi:hypothetical protein
MGNTPSLDDADGSTAGSYIVHYSVDDPSLDTLRNDSGMSSTKGGRKYQESYLERNNSYVSANDNCKTFDTITTNSSVPSSDMQFERDNNNNNNNKNNNNAARATQAKPAPRKPFNTRSLQRFQPDDVTVSSDLKNTFSGSIGDDQSHDTRENDPVMHVLSSGEDFSLDTTGLNGTGRVRKAIHKDGLKQVATVTTVASDQEASKTGKREERNDVSSRSLRQVCSSSSNRDVPNLSHDKVKQVLSEICSYHSEDDYDDGIDLRFVEQFEATFNAFLTKHPDLVSKNPKLVETIKILKLQKLLDVSYKAEGALIEHVEASSKKKTDMAKYYQSKLVEAARQKASREIQLEHEWKNIAQGYKIREGELTWKLIQKSRSRARKHEQLTRDSDEVVNPRTILNAMPESAETAPIRDAVVRSIPRRNTPEMESDMQRLAAENDFLSAEINVLEKKVAYQREAAKNNAWVDSALVRLDDDLLRGLKKQYHKKLQQQQQQQK